MRLQCYINLPKAASPVHPAQPQRLLPSHTTPEQWISLRERGEGNFLNKTPQLLWLALQMLGMGLKKEMEHAVEETSFGKHAVWNCNPH